MQNKKLVEEDIEHYRIFGTSTEGMSTREVKEVFGDITSRAARRFKVSHPLRRKEKLEIRITEEKPITVGASTYEVVVVPSGSTKYQV